MLASCALVFGYTLLAFIFWKLIQRLTATKNPLSDVAGPEKEHWLKGNYHRIFQDGLQYNLQLAEQYGGAIKVHALLGDEQLYVSDPRALHHIVVKDQHIYEETDMFIMANKLIFGDGLISTLGEQHRKQRKMLNPVFSLANMRALLPIIQPIADTLGSRLLSFVPVEDGAEVNVMPWISRAALEYISQAALGHTFHALDPDANNEYAEAVRNLAPTALRLLLLRPFIPFLLRIFPLAFLTFLADNLPLPPLRELRRITLVMDNASRWIFSQKKEASQGNTDGGDGEGKTNGQIGERMRGRDIMSTMLRANASSDKSDRLTDNELLGQMNTFIFAGFETTTSAVCRMLYILASKPDVQTRLREEIRKTKIQFAGMEQGNVEGWEKVDLPYDVLMNMPYLDAILRETLRVYPPTSLLGRIVRKDVTLPLEYPVRSTSGASLSAIPLRKGTMIIMSLLAANHNKSVWGVDASEWRPERWLTPTGERVGFDSTLDEAQEGGAGERTSGNKGVGVKYPGVYASMMTFLGGGRACIGFKFAEMEMKQVLTTLLSTLHFSLPSVLDTNGYKKEIYWKMNGLQVPVVRPPAGDNVTAQMPLRLRRVCAEDFL